jgi:hypothetical protein
VKPEIWQDENVGDLSLGARVLLIGLITMADDEGRLRALPALILGHVFPYDEVNPAKLKRWIGEIEGGGFILSYAAEGKPYIAFRHWARHQKPNRARPSLLPEPTDAEVVTNNSLKDHGENIDRDVDNHGSITPSRVGAGSDPFPDPVPICSSSEFDEWLEHYVATTSYTGTTGTKSAKEAFAARRKEGISLEDLKLATVGCHSDDFCREHHHDVPDTILRVSKVTRYIKMAKATRAPKKDRSAYSRVEPAEATP